MADVILPLVVLIVVLLLFRLSLRNVPVWRATVTPLASIIGSGFLVSGPLLTHITNVWAPLAMAGILLIAYALGSVIRFNIVNTEPLLADSRHEHAVIPLQRLADFFLGVAYIVSVAFYVRLMASFVLRFGSYHDDVIENTLTTVVLLGIAIVGWLRGLGGLEKMEVVAVIIKLSIIAALLVGLISFDWYWLQSSEPLASPDKGLSFIDRMRLLAGLLLIVQGFETSRYLGQSYNAKVRVQSMRYAQLIASVIYLLFVITALPLLMEFHGNADETAIIGLAGRVAEILSPMLVLAAVMSQFSAAVADTLGAGGLFSELSGNRISDKSGYVCLIIAAVVLVWTQNVFEIITLASRLFAGYYLIESVLAIVVSLREPAAEKGIHVARMILFFAMVAVLLAIILFAIPVA